MPSFDDETREEDSSRTVTPNSRPRSKESGAITMEADPADDGDAFDGRALMD